MKRLARSLSSRLRDRLAPVSALLAGLLCAGLPVAAGAQDAYPTRPVTLIVPIAPGGVADTVGRPVAEAMSRLLGQPVLVVARLREVARRAAEDERVVRTIATPGTPMQYLDAPEFARFVQADAAMIAAVVRRIGKQ